MPHRSFLDLVESIPSVSATNAHVLIRRFETLRPLSRTDKDTLIRATQSVRDVEAQTILVQEGDKPNVVHVGVEGVACRYKIVDDGKRQIVGFLVPGDICDGHGFILDHVDCSVAVLTDSRIAAVRTPHQ